jgi:radical SAM superfamily enzyme YgiQ (UPF0313 family)
MKILLINPPCGPRTIGLHNIARVEPLGLELIGAGVSKDHDVRLVDMEVRTGDLAHMLSEFKPDVAAVTSEIVHVDTAIDALKEVRAVAPDCLTVVGGHHPTLWPKDFDHPVVDVIVIGEGVFSFAEICAARNRGETDFSAIPGLVIRAGEEMVATAMRPMQLSLDEQPMPDRSLTARYREDYFYLFEKNVAAVRTSAGCSFPCIFCSCRVYSHGLFIPRAPELVFEEIKTLDEEFIIFCDDHSFHDPERMRVLGQMLLDAGIKKRFFAYGRADSIAENREVYALWAKVGLALVMVGLESIDEEALKRVGKRGGLDSNEDAVRILGELGIALSAGFLVEPHFTKPDFDAIDAYIKARPSILLAEFTPLTPFPGTVLYRKLEESVLTHDRQVYDLQHFVVPTVLPPAELYRLMLRSYRGVAFRLIRTLQLWRPSMLFSAHGRRLLMGFLRNFTAYKRAHLDVPRERDPALGPDTVSGPPAPVAGDGAGSAAE